MAKQVAKSGLAVKLSAKSREVFEENKAKPPEADAGARLPAGIENGVAQLRTCKFGIYQKGDFVGEYFFQATGRVVEPAEVNGTPVRGLITRLGPVPICDTPKRNKSQADNFDQVRQVLARLKGGTLEEYGAEEVEGIAALIEEAKPYFRFRTWKGAKQVLGQKGGKWYLFNGDGDGKPVGAPIQGKGPYPSEAAAKAVNPYAGREPLVNEVWSDCCEYVPADDAGAGVDDSSGDEAPSDDKPTNATTSAADEDRPADEAADGEEGGVDLRSLVEAADRNDGDDAECVEAQQAIIVAAEPLGIDTDAYDTWGEVVDLIEAGGAGESESEGGAEEEEGENEWEPSKGETIEARLKGLKKPVKSKITSVDAKSKTVTIQRLDNKALVESVSWELLVHE